METLLQDIRFGVRVLRKSPGFTAVAVIALALGIGGNTAIFSAVNAVILRPLPYAAPDRLVFVRETSWQPSTKGTTASWPNYADWRDQSSTFEGLAAAYISNYNLKADTGVERVSGAAVTANTFATLGVDPLLGRAFLDEEDRPNGPSVAVLGHGLWQRRFGGNPEILGRTIDLEGKQTTVVGVMPKGFEFPIESERADLWVPLAGDEEALPRGAHFIEVVGRLKDGVTIDQAKGDLAAVAERLGQQYPDTNENRSVLVFPLHDWVVGDVRDSLLLLLGAVGFVLLIACANVANLLLARARARQREVAIRLAVGAGRLRLVRQFLVESLLLAIAGGAVGLLLATWGSDILAAAGPKDIPRLNEAGADWTVLLFTLGVSALTGIVFGLAPAIQLSRPELADSLKGTDPRSGGAGSRIRSALVVSEVALALVLLVGAGLMLASFARLIDVKPGFDPEQVLTAHVSLPDVRYEKIEQQIAFGDEILTRVRALPGVEAAGVATTLPLSGNSLALSLKLNDGVPRDPKERLSVGYDAISPGYFEAMGIPLREGRDFAEQDRASAPNVVVISESVARKYWPNESALGKKLTIGISIDDNPPPEREVVGIVGDVKHGGLDATKAERVYSPYAQTPWTSMAVAVRSQGDPAALSGAIRREVLGIDDGLPVYDVTLMRGVVGSSVARPRLVASLFGAFAAVALLLAAVGIYGVMAYTVSQRTHEIGIRLALGARPVDVLRLVVGQGMGLAGLGIAIGLAGAFGVTRLMSSLLFGVSATDPVVFASIAALLAAVAFAACYLPARRAARVDPVTALRYE
jgi:putative ABC transport system permease protein